MAIAINNFSNYSITENGIITNIKTMCIKKHWLGKNGYYYVDLQQNGIKQKIAIHRLLAIHFIPNSSNKEQVNHIDGNKLNNNVSNLEWVTRQQNTQHAFRTGLAKSGRDHFAFKGEIIGVNVTTGETFTMAGTAEMVNRGFQYALVYKIANGKAAIHKGHDFYWAKDIDAIRAAGIKVKE